MCNVLYANTVRITSKYANIRSGAGTDYRKIGEAHKGDGYNLLSTSGGWVKISFRGASGWVSKSLVDIERDREEVSSGECTKANIASYAVPLALTAGCCVVATAVCPACVIGINGAEIVASLLYEDKMDKIYEGVFCD